MSATPLSCRESVSCGLGDFSFLCAITGFISILAVSLPVSMKDYWLVLDHCVSSLLKQCFWHGTWPSTQIYSAGGGCPISIFKPIPERKFSNLKL